MSTFKSSFSPNELIPTLGLSIQGIYKFMSTNNIEATKVNRRNYIPSTGVRRILELRHFVYPYKNISFQIVKGGTGKTSLAFSLAVRASQYGAKVLAIDFDQQANLTQSLNIDARENPVWLNIFRDRVSVSESIINVTESLSLIPSNMNNSRLDVELTHRNVNLKDHIRDKLSKVRENYDLVVMDCPPAINKINPSIDKTSQILL